MNKFIMMVLAASLLSGCGHFRKGCGCCKDKAAATESKDGCKGGCDHKKDNP